MKILSVFGTRSEAIKMAPLVMALSKQTGVAAPVCVTGQDGTREALALFKLRADYDLALMSPNQTLNDLSGKVLNALDSVLNVVRPDWLLVHGDTSVAMSTALCAFHKEIPVGHVEAGLHAGTAPPAWPQEMNRMVVDGVSDQLFAPTALSKSNLLKEKITGKVLVTGSTGVDALRVTDEALQANALLREAIDRRLPPSPAPSRKTLLILSRHREPADAGFFNLCTAARQLAARSDMDIVYVADVPPVLQGPTHAMLSGLENVHLLSPLDYLSSARLLQRAYVLLTDSPGLQEDAPYFGKPILLTSPDPVYAEALAVGTVKLVGGDTGGIVHAVSQLYDRPDLCTAFDQKINPYGDGFAANRIAASLCGQPIPEFVTRRSARPACLV